MAELVSIKRNVDVSPGQAAPAVFHCSQGDVGSKIILGLLNNGTAYSIPSGVTVTIEGSESNGSIFTPISATASGSDITFYLTGEMTAVAGPAICQAVLKSGSNILGTANFTLEVESSPMGADAPPVFTDAGWTWMLNKLTTEFVPALGDNIIDAIDSKLDKNQGTANAGKYLKVGADGNVETAATDTTLSVSGDAADAKAVGDELDDLKTDLTQVQCPNLMGMSGDVLYPVFLKSGTAITFSTADGSSWDKNYRFYFYDKNSIAIDWYGIYPSDGNARTFTFNVDVYWLGWQPNNIPAVNVMVNIGNTKIPYVPYYNPYHSFKSKGTFPNTDANKITEPGWYYTITANSISNLPNNLNDNAVQLLVYNKGVSYLRVTQELVTSGGFKFIRTVGRDGANPTDWIKLATSTALLRDTENENSKVVSLSGNYFDPNKADWKAGIYNSSTGAVTGDLPYKYAIVPLQGAGTYVKTGLGTTFGINIIRFPLLDENKKFITYIQGTAEEHDTSGTYSSKVIITEDIFRDAKYTVLHMDENNPYVPKLFYDANIYTASMYESSIPPKYGFTSDHLYKKTIVCDGDSICEGVADLPKQFGAYFGRLKLNYQIIGTNYSVGGGTICDMTDTTVGGNPRHSVAVNIDTIHSAYDDLDYLILEGGTNDADLIGRFSGDTPPNRFGTWSETDFSGNYDNSTFCGAIEYLFCKALTYYPHAKIGFIIAMEMGTNSATAANRKRYFDEIVKIAKKWHIPILNLWDKSGADARLTSFYDPSKTSAENVTAKSFYYDGQHPTSYGYDKMQNMIEEWIKTL